MKYRTIVVQMIPFLVILSFAPGCHGGLLDLQPFGSWYENDAKSSRIVAYEQDIPDQIEMFKNVLIEPKCSPVVNVESYCEAMKSSYCDVPYIYQQCLGTCCSLKGYVNDTTKGCASPCDGHSFCHKTTDPERPELSHCEPNSFTAVNLRPVITEMELEWLLSLPVVGE